MKKTVLGIVLAMVLTFGLCANAFASEEPEPANESAFRLAGVVTGGITYTFIYDEGGCLPTGILKNGESDAAVSYDEMGNMVSYQDPFQAYSRTFDEAGRLLEDIHTHLTSNAWETVTTYSYDEEGNCVSECTTYADAPSEYGMPSSSQTEYTYDAEGNILLEASVSSWGDGTESSSRREYTYNEQGNCTGYTAKFVSSDSTETTSTYEYDYSFDEEGRIASQTTYENGEKSDVTTYTYDGEDRKVREEHESGDTLQKCYYYMPLLDGSWARSIWYTMEGAPLEDTSLYVALADTYGYAVYSWSLACSEPQVSYDDNGYLIKVSDDAGNCIEFTYEPVA